MPFKKLSLIEPLLRAVQSQGYAAPTPIQERAFPHVVQGKDLLGCAQTGTGKTAAFALPILQRLSEHHGKDKKGKKAIRCLVLSPTRELAAQIGESFKVYGRFTGLRHTVIFGGVKQGPQCRALSRGVDILVATPGRLIDLIDQGEVDLKKIEIFVLDEADRMLDMGFIHDIRRVISYVPQKRQTLLFSATMPREIKKLADTLLHDPVTIKVAAVSAAADTVQQGVYHVQGRGKGKLLERLLNDPDFARTLVFCRTKRGADRVAKRLNMAGIRADAIHSDKTQAARTRALDKFKRGSSRVLVASDIASRGIDVDEVSHVINYDMPNDAETYVHRIGRTGRAGLTGRAITFCGDDDQGVLRSIERMLKRPVEVLSCSVQSAQSNSHGDEIKKERVIHPMASKSTSIKKPRRDNGSPEQQKQAFWKKNKSSKKRSGRGANTGLKKGRTR